MARARNIKPGFFKNEVLADLPVHWRLLFIGLWTLADRAGRLEYRPKRIKADLFPYDAIDVECAIRELCAAGFLILYEMGGQLVLQVANWEKHQRPHHKEIPSQIPGPLVMDESCTAQHGLIHESSMNHARAVQPVETALDTDSLILNTDTGYLDTDTLKKLSREEAAPSVILPEWLDPEAWKDWNEYRKRRGKGWTRAAQLLSLRTLAKWYRLGNDPRAVIEQSIERGYTGLFEIKEGGPNGHQGNSAVERVERAIRAGRAARGEA